VDKKEPLENDTRVLGRLQKKSILKRTFSLSKGEGWGEGKT
jgi:hypothetical protein